MEKDDYYDGVKNLEDILGKLDKHAQNVKALKELQEKAAAENVGEVELKKSLPVKIFCPKCGDVVVANAFMPGKAANCQKCGEVPAAPENPAKPGEVASQVRPPVSATHGSNPTPEAKPAEVLPPAVVPDAGAAKLPYKESVLKKVVAALMVSGAAGMLSWQLAPMHARLDGVREYCAYDKELIREDVKKSRAVLRSAGDFIRDVTVICDKHVATAKTEVEAALKGASALSNGVERDWENGRKDLEALQDKINLLPESVRPGYLRESEALLGVIIKKLDMAEAKRREIAEKEAARKAAVAACESAFSATEQLFTAGAFAAMQGGRVSTTDMLLLCGALQNCVGKCGARKCGRAVPSMFGGSGMIDTCDTLIQQYRSMLAPGN